MKLTLILETLLIVVSLCFADTRELRSLQDSVEVPSDTPSSAPSGVVSLPPSQSPTPAPTAYVTLPYLTTGPPKQQHKPVMNWAYMFPLVGMSLTFMAWALKNETCGKEIDVEDHQSESGSFVEMVDMAEQRGWAESSVSDFSLMYEDV